VTAIKRDPIDTVLSTLVRMRDAWTCLRCRKQYVQGDARGLDASHICGRAKRATRYYPPNLVSHCRGCHQYLGANPMEFTEWTENYHGKEFADYLKRLGNTTIKLSKQDKADILADYKAQLETMQPGDDLETPAVLLLKIRSAGL